MNDNVFHSVPQVQSFLHFAEKLKKIAAKRVLSDYYYLLVTSLHNNF